MPYYLSGNLCGQLCRDLDEPLSGLEVRIYAPDPNLPLDELVAAGIKSTLALLSPSQVEAKASRLLASDVINENGDFQLMLDEKKFGGGPVEIDVYARTVPHRKDDGENPPPRQFSITTFQPVWDQTPNGIYGTFFHCLPEKFWCYFRSLFDAWVIAGRVVACKNQSLPIGGVEVVACDKDYVQDDNLGTATTDPDGYFRIDYTSADFKRTLLSWLSPIFDIETPIPPVNSGPDVYFYVKSGSDYLLKEPRNKGKEPGRENIGHCFCIRLCADVPVPDDGGHPLQPTVWTNIGDQFTLPDAVSLNDFDADGHGQSGGIDFAFHGVTRLLGGAPRIQNGNDVEYRFLVSDTTTPNGAAAPPLASFARIVGVGANANLFYENTSGGRFKLGQMIRFSPSFQIVNVYAELGDLDADGWMNVNGAIERTFVADPTLNPVDLLITPGDLGSYFWSDTDYLMALDTRKITTEVSPATVDPGLAISGLTPGTEQIAIRFEAREVVAPGTYIPLPGSGQTLNRMVINNDALYLSLAMTEHLSSTSCDVLTGTVHIAYTAYHPYLRAVQLHIRANNEPSATALGDPPRIPLPTPSPDQVYNPATNIVPISGTYTLHRCTYIVTLTGRRRLHNGDSSDPNHNRQTAFFYDPAP